jgi:hypothetical protein
MWDARASSIRARDSRARWESQYLGFDEFAGEIAQNIVENPSLGMCEAQPHGVDTANDLLTGNQPQHIDTTGKLSIDIVHSTEISDWAIAGQYADLFYGGASSCEMSQCEN